MHAEDHQRRNLNCALKWWRELQAQGYDPMLFDTNTQGGYHIWVLFEKAVPTVDVYAMVKSIAETWEENGLDEEPETFPKKVKACLLYTSPSPRDQRGSRMPSSA